MADHTIISKHSCFLCEGNKLEPIFTESKFGRNYTSYYCPSCKLHQTLGDIDNISPDYVNLIEDDLDDAHRFLQSSHKEAAFHQWYQLIKRFNVKPLPDCNLLDIGCGIGGFLDFSSTLGANVFGFDASKTHINETRKRYPTAHHATTIREYMFNLDVSPNIDMITMWDVFEHIRHPESLLSEIHMLLSKTNGLLYVSIPSGALNRLKVRIAELRGQPIGLIPWEHVYYYTPSSLRKVLERAGFDVLKIGGVKPYVRYPITAHEAIRRIAHSFLRHTSYSLQIYAVARPRLSTYDDDVLKS